MARFYNRALANKHKKSIKLNIITKINFVIFILAIGLLLWALEQANITWFVNKKIINDDFLNKPVKELKVGFVYNPLSYYLSNDGFIGYDYDLSKEFAKYLNVPLNAVVYANENDLLNGLNNDEIDMAASLLLYDEDLLNQYSVSPAYSGGSLQVVYRRGEKRPKNIDDVSKILVSAGSQAYFMLVGDKIDSSKIIAQNKNNEELLFDLSSSSNDDEYAVVSSFDLKTTQSLRSNLNKAFDFTPQAGVHWYFKLNSKYAIKSVDFINSVNNNGMLARLKERYLNYLATNDYVDNRSFLRAIETELPKYLDLFKKYSGELDWQTLAAVSYQESNWNPNAVSPTGVKGMMMLTNDTAKRMGVNDRVDINQSIEGGAKYLMLMRNQLPEGIAENDRLWFALLAYNMGYGHMLDARRLTKKLGQNPNNWIDVKSNLLKLTQKQYYEKLEFGYARGHEALNYVDNIRRYLNILHSYLRVEGDVGQK